MSVTITYKRKQNHTNTINLCISSSPYIFFSMFLPLYYGLMATVVSPLFLTIKAGEDGMVETKKSWVCWDWTWP
jgi:hypothetical protein